MQRGSLVKCNTNFEEERAQYKRHPYPYKNDLLVVSGVTRSYPSGTLLLTFEELRTKLTIPLSENCFDEIQTPEEGESILRKVMKFLTK